ncbi:hypothetical protein [Pararobbsia silviterrae]|uniref:Uncharacterized protein n=1 Tax=Pararobbsia silviterrae TaxID=1792498 RepID=A0A494X8F0_9BURK|nr:hypothetical protein [Pararobbsia silviterrae]RKP46542.1 hypothetical protein D7S86_23835 [Pararobbsia silviterrae]
MDQIAIELRPLSGRSRSRVERAAPAPQPCWRRLLSVRNLAAAALNGLAATTLWIAVETSTAFGMRFGSPGRVSLHHAMSAGAAIGGAGGLIAFTLIGASALAVRMRSPQVAYAVLAAGGAAGIATGMIAGPLLARSGWESQRDAVSLSFADNGSHTSET